MGVDVGSIVCRVVCLRRDEGFFEPIQHCDTGLARPQLDRVVIHDPHFLQGGLLPELL